MLQETGYAAEDVPVKHKINGDLYNALMREAENNVMEICQRVPDHALHILTIHNDTVLHMATFSKRADLALRLLDELPQHQLDKMTRQNDLGNTILHEAATSNNALNIADKVLRMVPGLLGLRNNNGESALFRAARYGNTEIFNFLANKIYGYNQASQKPFLQRNDKTTILHISILSHHYDMALRIAKDYKYLIGEQDGDGMTSLQILSCNPSAFKHELEHGIDMQLINSIKLCCSAYRREEVQKEKQSCKSAIELAKFLIERDTSWVSTNSGMDQSKPTIHKYGVRSDASSSGKSGEEGQSTAGPLGQREWEGETPLILATKSGCVEIVKEILQLYPQAIEYIDDEGRNILHVAVKYRQLEIFNLVTKMKVPMRRLARKIDNNGNTILHMVGTKITVHVPEKMQGPAFLLQEELLWFERVKEIIPPHFLDHQNHKRHTAVGIFEIANSELRSSAKEWLKSTAEGCSVVAVLIATVAFAAAYTIPGGSNGSTGLPVLLYEPLFVVFTLTDVLSLTFALTSVVTFLSILTSPFRFKDFKRALPHKLILSFTLLFLSVAMMMVAFAATFLLMIRRKESWTKIILYTLSSIPVGIFAVTYFPLYSSFSKTYKYLLRKTKQAISWNKHFLAQSKNSNLYERRETQFLSSSFP